MVDVSFIGKAIRFPFELLGKIINFVFGYIIEIIIVVGAITLIYYLFKGGVIEKITDWYLKKEETVNEEPQEEKEIINFDVGEKW